MKLIKLEDHRDEEVSVLDDLKLLVERIESGEMPMPDVLFVCGQITQGDDVAFLSYDCGSTMNHVQTFGLLETIKLILFEKWW